MHIVKPCFVELLFLIQWDNRVTQIFLWITSRFIWSWSDLKSHRESKGFEEHHLISWMVIKHLSMRIRIGFRFNFATCWANLKNFVNLPQLQCSHLSNEDKYRICLLRLLWGLNEIMSGKYLAVLHKCLLLLQKVHARLGIDQLNRVFLFELLLMPTWQGPIIYEGLSSITLPGSPDWPALGSIKITGAGGLL